MGKSKRHISEAQAKRREERAYTVGLAAGGVSLRRISHRVGRSIDTVKRTLKRAKGRKGLGDAPRSGRPTKVNNVLKRQIGSLMLDDDYGSAPKVSARLKRLGKNVSASVVQKVAKSLALKSYVRREKYELTDDQKAARLAFAIAHKSDTPEERARIVYLDEKLFICNLKSLSKRYDSVIAAGGGPTRY